MLSKFYPKEKNAKEIYTYSNSKVVREMRGSGRGGEVRDAWKVPVRKFRVRRVVVPRVYTYKSKTRSFQPHHHNQARLG